MVNQCNMDQDQCGSRAQEPSYGKAEVCVAWLEDSLLKGRIGAAGKDIFRRAPDVLLPGRRILESVTSHIESDNLGWLGPDAG